MWNSNFLKMKRLWSGKDEGEITRNEKWESIRNLSREEKGKSKEGKKKLRWEVFEEFAWERGRGHFLDGNEGFSREDIKGRLREKKKRGLKGESQEVGKRYRFEKEWERFWGKQREREKKEKRKKSLREVWEE